MARATSNSNGEWRIKTNKSNKAIFPELHQSKFLIVRFEVDDIGVDVGKVFPAVKKYYMTGQICNEPSGDDERVIIKLHYHLRTNSYNNISKGTGKFSVARRDLYTIKEFNSLLLTGQACTGERVLFNMEYLLPKDVLNQNNN